MTTRTIIALVLVLGLTFAAGALWFRHVARKQAAAEEAMRQAEEEARKQSHRPYVVGRPLQKDAGPCSCMAGDPLCSCL